MSHYTVLTNDDGSVAQILRDGEPYGEGVTFEPPHQIVSTYFKIARTNLDAMRTAQESDRKRSYGLQSFLMTLTGVEAFTNVFFQLRAREQGNPELEKVSGKQGPFVARLRDCLALAFNEPLPGQEALLDRIRQLYKLRNQIVHPRWEPVSVSLGGLIIADLCQNFQATFENQDFCEEAFWWCVALVARVGTAAGNKAIEAPCFYWAGIYMLTEDTLLEKLGLKTHPTEDQAGKTTMTTFSDEEWDALAPHDKHALQVIGRVAPASFEPLEKFTGVGVLKIQSLLEKGLVEEGRSVPRNAVGYRLTERGWLAYERYIGG